MEPVTPENAKAGQTIKLGDKTLRVIFTEGHYKPKGHISVELLETNLLVSGDVICNNILPPIAAGGDLEALLARAGILNGTEATVYQSEKNKKILSDNGAVVKADELVLSGNILTAAGPETSRAFGEKLVELLK